MNTITRNRIIAGFICMFFMLLGTQSFAEGDIKAKIGVDYYKLMNDKSFIKVEVKYKFEKKYQAAADLELNVYRNIDEDSLQYVGSVTTNADGIAEYEIDPSHFIADSIVTYKYTVAIENNELLEDGDKQVKFKDCIIHAEAVEIDSVQHISIQFTNAAGEPLEDEDVDLKVQRLFAPLKIGDSYTTDENGEILIPIEDPLPGIDGVLTFEVIHDSRSYGIVKNIFDAQIGTVIVDQSTFDKRTMWSPANKTPLFLLIFPNLIIFGIWAVIALLIFNIYKIYKS